jgi:hypothetical protein
MEDSIVRFLDFLYVKKKFNFQNYLKLFEIIVKFVDSTHGQELGHQQGHHGKGHECKKGGAKNSGNSGT